MGKRGKKQQESRRGRHHRAHGGDGDGDDLPSSAYDLPSPSDDREEDDEENESLVVQELEEQEGNGGDWFTDAPSKFHLYQLSVQAPKGDISYLQKFFLVYVGSRFPLHLQEDFCGTALLSVEWIRSDSRRTAVGVDLDLEALNWCLGNNLSKIGADADSRISLFCGNVLQPQEACIVRHSVEDLVKGLDIVDSETYSQQCDNNSIMKNVVLPKRDIICAFNYSCCCLQRRKDLILYFKHALNALAKKGGIFVMDLYGGTSSERRLHLQRRFSSFTYIWEQQEFDILNRRTRISIHFHLGKHRTIRHAFSYDWRLSQRLLGRGRISVCTLLDQENGGHRGRWHYGSKCWP